MKIKEEMHHYKYVEIILDDFPNGFTHTDCKMGILTDQGIVVQSAVYSYFYPINKIVRLCTSND